MGVYNASAGSLIGSSSLIKQINFTHEALVLKEIANTLAGFLISAGTLMIGLLLFGIYPSWTAIFFPFTLLPILSLGMGIGMLVAVITVVAHDVNKMGNMLLGFVMFLTPIIYTPTIENRLIQTIVFWNPLSYLIGGARDLLLYGHIGNVSGYLLSTILSLVVFLLSWAFFFSI